MKQYIPTIISILSCILVLVSMLKISQLEDEINRIRSENNSNYSNLQSNIANITANVNAALEEQSNILASSSYKLDNVDYKQLSVELSCFVTPKIFQPEGTTATILCNDKEYEMDFVDGSYQVTFPISLLESNLVEKVSFVKDGTISTQSLDWYLDLRNKYLPTMHAGFSGQFSSSLGDWTKRVYNGSVNVDVTVPSDGECSMQALDLVYYIDGEEISRQDMLDLPEEGNAYFGSSFKTTITNDDPLELSYELKETFEQPAGSTMRLCVEMIDNNGLIYISIIEGCQLDANGQIVEGSDDFWRHECAIYDQNRQLLYGSEEGYDYLYK